LHLSIRNDAIFLDCDLGSSHPAPESPPAKEIEMAHLLRKVAIIGLIAWNSPVHGGKPADSTLPQTIRQAVETAEASARGVAGSLTAAREAAQILAGLDPAIRERVLSTVATTATTRTATR
jgi:hypothetical protein